MAEKMSLMKSIGEERNAHVEETNTIRASLAEEVSSARQDLSEVIEEKNTHLDENNASDEGVTIENFVYDLTSIAYSPNGPGLPNSYGVQRYGKLVANKIQDQINDYG